MNETNFCLAASTTLHMVSPVTFKYKYFQRAIIESNPVSLKFKTLDEMDETAQIFGLLTGCPAQDQDCFKNLTVDTILHYQYESLFIPTRFSQILAELPWGPTIDLDIIPDQPLALYQQGKFYPVPLIIGSNQNETVMFASKVADFVPPNELGYEFALALLFGVHAPEVERRYPLSQTNMMDTINQLATDFLFICPARSIAAIHATKASGTFLPLHPHFFLPSCSLPLSQIRNQPFLLLTQSLFYYLFYDFWSPLLAISFLFVLRHLLKVLLRLFHVLASH